MQIPGSSSSNLFHPAYAGESMKNHAPNSFVNNGSPQDTLAATLPSAESALSQPSTYGQDGSLLFGNVSLDLRVARSESLTREFSSKGPDGYSQIRQSMSRSYESNLSLDFAFLAKMDGAAEKLAKMDPAVFSEWTSVASRLMEMNKDDFADFISSTDDLFNEIEAALGLGPEGLDYVADFFTDKVSEFLGGVEQQLAYFEANPLGEGKDMGLNLPSLMDGIMSALPKDMKEYLATLMANLEERLLSSIGSNREMMKSIDQLYRDLLLDYQVDNNEIKPKEELEAPPKAPGPEIR